MEPGLGFAPVCGTSVIVPALKYLHLPSRSTTERQACPGRLSAIRCAWRSAVVRRSGYSKPLPVSRSSACGVWPQPCHVLLARPSRLACFNRQQPHQPVARPLLATSCRASARASSVSMMEGASGLRLLDRMGRRLGAMSDPVRRRGCCAAVAPVGYARVYVPRRLAVAPDLQACSCWITILNGTTAGNRPWGVKAFLGPMPFCTRMNPERR